MGNIVESAAGGEERERAAGGCRLSAGGNVVRATHASPLQGNPPAVGVGYGLWALVVRGCGYGVSITATW